MSDKQMRGQYAREFKLDAVRQVTPVERSIGLKRGNGGTTGAGYLRRMLDMVLFPEIWKLRTDFRVE